MTRSYSWVRIAPTHTWATEEQIDGTPDWFVYRDGGEWFAKGRTSAQRSGPFKTRRAAIDHAEGTDR